MSTVSTWTTIAGLTIPVPRRAAPIVTIANWSASPGKNQWRYSVPAAAVAAVALRFRM